MLVSESARGPNVKCQTFYWKRWLEVWSVCKMQAILSYGEGTAAPGLWIHQGVHTCCLTLHYLLVALPVNGLTTVEPMTQWTKPPSNSQSGRSIFNFLLYWQHFVVCYATAGVVFYAYWMIDCVSMHIENCFSVASAGQKASLFTIPLTASEKKRLQRHF